MSSQININGMSFSYDDGKIIISGINNSKQQDIKMDKNGNIQGDVTGNINVTGSNVTIIINGDVTGNIVNCKNIEVKGDIVGNVTRC